MKRPNTAINAEHARVDALALEVLAHPSMIELQQRLATDLLDSPQGRTSSGARTIGRALDALAAASVNYVMTEAGGSDELRWSVLAERDLGDVSFPNSGYGIENPDNVYRLASLDASSRYELRGRIDPTHRPVEVHLEIRDGIPGMTALNPEAGLQLSTLALDEKNVDDEGRFSVLIEPGGPNGSATMSSGADKPAHLIIRDLLDDWGSEMPCQVELVRLDGPVPLPPDLDRLAELTTRMLDTIARFWITYFATYSYPRVGNAVAPARVRPGGRGASSGGWFSLADDDALVITLDPLSARSMGIQVTDPWGLAYEYRHRTSSLNTSQSTPNADGTYTFVLSPQDPGVPNWLDPSGHGSGLMAVRWQAFEDEPSDAGVIESRCVKLDALEHHLPEGTPRMDATEREAQRADRARDFFRRFPTYSE
ncbi:hypothetical protein [Enemella sp. A6]|uniref:hypothetical protein n=1 Tax=Enemella sp. A6 TaxID=3440152 RepID=UPI003EBFD34F